jgi:hypothetical protein
MPSTARHDVSITNLFLVFITSGFCSRTPGADGVIGRAFRKGIATSPCCAYKWLGGLGAERIVVERRAISLIHVMPHTTDTHGCAEAMTKLLTS